MPMKDTVSDRFVFRLQLVIAITSTDPQVTQIYPDGGCVHATFVTLFLPISEDLVVTFINTNGGGGGDTIFTVIITVEFEVCDTH
jgi:hypothetical protein